MPRRRVVDVQPSIRGLNLAADSNHLAPDELREAKNVRLSEAGGATGRLGTRRIHAAALPASVQNGFGWIQSGSASELVVSNGTLYTATFGTPTTFTPQSGALSNTGAPMFAPFRDAGANVVYIGDGGPLNKWNGTTLTVNIASTPNVRLLAVYNERLFGASGNDDTLHFSALGDGDTLGNAGAGGGAAAVRVFGQRRITALLPLGGSLLLLHERGISRFTGLSLDDINISAGTQGYSVDVGTTAPRSLVSVDLAAMVATERGIYWLTEGNAELVSQKITPVFRSLASTDLANVTAVHCRSFNEVWFFIPGAGVYVYNYLAREWSGPWPDGFLSPALTAIWETQNSNGTPIVLAGDSSGWVRWCDVPSLYRDNALSDGSGGTTYKSVTKFHRMTCGDPANEKSLRWGYLYADLGGSLQCVVRWQTRSGGGSFTLTPNDVVAWDDAGTAWDAGQWDEGSGTAVQMFRVPMSGYGPDVDVSVEDDGGRAILISRFDLEAFSMGRRG